jgi:hypothetical protein
MKKVTLAFKTTTELWEFKMRCHASDVQINFHHCTLSCLCSKEEIELAMKEYHAEMKDSQPAKA